MNKPFWGGCSIFLSGHPRLRDTLLMLWSFFPLYSMLRLPAESLALSQSETGLSFSVEQRVPLLCYTIYHELFINHLTCISWNRNTHSRTIAKVFKCCIYLVVWWSSPRWNYNMGNHNSPGNFGSFRKIFTWPKWLRSWVSSKAILGRMTRNFGAIWARWKSFQSIPNC